MSFIIALLIIKNVISRKKYKNVLFLVVKSSDQSMRVSRGLMSDLQNANFSLCATKINFTNKNPINLFDFCYLISDYVFFNYVLIDR